jgi:hypothetical protein
MSLLGWNDTINEREETRDLYWLISTSTNVEGFAVQWIERKYFEREKDTWQLT